MGTGSLKSWKNIIMTPFIRNMMNSYRSSPFKISSYVYPFLHPCELYHGGLVERGVFVLKEWDGACINGHQTFVLPRTGPLTLRTAHAMASKDHLSRGIATLCCDTSKSALCSLLVCTGMLFLFCLLFVAGYYFWPSHALMYRHRLEHLIQSRRCICTGCHWYRMR